MTYPHEDPEFEPLLRIVASRTPGLGVALVEKDYWVTHTLWALQRSGLDVYFKGGTSLSKAFSLIQRFSEDIDVWVDRGSLGELPEVRNWRSGNRGPTRSRRRFYEALPTHLEIPGATVDFDPGHLTPGAFGALYLVRYPGNYLAGLPPPNLPYVQVEAGYADVFPNLPADLSSFVHDFLESEEMLDEFEDNRPRGLPTVHPLATLIEKLEAIERRYARDEDFDATSFVRHYEDAAHIVLAGDRLPGLDLAPAELAREMLDRRQVRRLPAPSSDAFRLDDPDKRRRLEQAHAAIEHMFWGPRLSLRETCEVLSGWLVEQGIHSATS